MGTYCGRAMVTISLVCRVEAETAQEAIDKLTASPISQLCYQCTHQGVSNKWVPVNGLDGEIEQLELY